MADEPIAAAEPVVVPVETIVEPVAEPAPVAEVVAKVPAATAEVTAEAPPENLLTATEPTPAEPAKPAIETPEPVPEVEAKPEAEAVVEPEAAPEPIAYEPFTLPEGVTLQGERLDDFRQFASDNRLSQETAQGLVDRHIAEMGRLQEQITADNLKAWNDARAGWRREIMADPEFGGAGFETSKAAAVQMLDRFVPAEERTEFNQALMLTGFTDHPLFFRFLNRMAKSFGESGTPLAPRNPSPVPNRPGNGLGALFDHPSSPQPR